MNILSRRERPKDADEGKMTIQDEAEGKESKVKIPAELPILPLKNVVVFPYIIVPLVISQQEHARLIDEALVGGKIVGLFFQRKEKNRKEGDLHDVGAAGQII